MAHLAHVLSEDLVEDVVDWQREAGLVLEQLLHQERVQVVRIHHVIPGTDTQIQVMGMFSEGE